MRNPIASILIASCAGIFCATAPFDAQAQSEASALSAVSALPIASVVVGSTAAASTVVALPVVLLTAGAVLVVKTVQSTARGTVYLLERASDGAQASVEIGARAVSGTALAVGSVVTVSVIGAGVVLSAAGEAIAFIPNALGRALLFNEKVTG